MFSLSKFSPWLPMSDIKILTFRRKGASDLEVHKIPQKKLSIYEDQPNIKIISVRDILPLDRSFQYSDRVKLFIKTMPDVSNEAPSSPLFGFGHGSPTASIGSAGPLGDLAEGIMTRPSRKKDKRSNKRRKKSSFDITDLATQMRKEKRQHKRQSQTRLLTDISSSGKSSQPFPQSSSFPSQPEEGEREEGECFSIPSSPGDNNNGPTLSRPSVKKAGDISRKRHKEEEKEKEEEFDDDESSNSMDDLAAEKKELERMLEEGGMDSMDGEDESEEEDDFGSRNPKEKQQTSLTRREEEKKTKKQKKNVSKHKEEDSENDLFDVMDSLEKERKEAARRRKK
ncbi:hypothetical protein ADUPG1_014265, partial [Aduncisulcus paluster]